MKNIRIFEPKTDLLHIAVTLPQPGNLSRRDVPPI